MYARSPLPNHIERTLMSFCHAGCVNNNIKGGPGKARKKLDLYIRSRLALPLWRHLRSLLRCVGALLLSGIHHLLDSIVGGDTIRLAEGLCFERLGQGLVTLLHGSLGLRQLELCLLLNAIQLP